MDASGDRVRIDDEGRRQYVAAMLQSHGLCIVGDD
jgi:hypothetical protein